MRRPCPPRRRAILTHAACAALPACIPPGPLLAAPPQPDAITLPMLACGSAFCTEYYVDDQRFRAVIDTGSPFLLVDGSNSACFEQRWGCYRPQSGGSGFALGDKSTEGYGGQEIEVDWRRGSLRLAGYPSRRATTKRSEVSFRRRGARAGSWTTPDPLRDVRVEPINFGVVKSYVGRGGSGAVYLGLAKQRQPRVRPTFLEQTPFAAMDINFVERTLTLDRKPLLRGKDAIPMVDLRPLGAPVTPYAVAVERLVVNGRPMALERPCVAIIDTGVTGMVVSDSLYDTDELPLPGAAMRTVKVEVRTERGKVVRFEAASRRRRSEEDDADVAPAVEYFPLIVTPVTLPWFDTERPWQQPRKQRLRADADGEISTSQSPHVIILGLSFLSDMRLTIDADEGRLATTRIV